MKTYLFSIFVRFFLAFSGVLVFVLTAYLYGAEGRGIIGYATSLFSIAGLLLSFNLGRGFLAETMNEIPKRKEIIGSFLLLNFILGILASLGGLAYWYFSGEGKVMLTFQQALFFSATSLFYIWTSNGNFFFSSFFKTSLQELVILSVRVCLIIFLVLLAYLKIKDINVFIRWYSMILVAGVLAENILLIFISKGHFRAGLSLEIVRKIVVTSFFHHVDYLAFNLFPLVITVVCAGYLSKSDVGRINFAIQIINIVFLLAVTANIRLMAYIGHGGHRVQMGKFKKLFVYTLGLSIFASIGIYYFLRVALSYFHLGQFEGVSSLFLVSVLAIPGYILYQFLTPIWIEMKVEKRMAVLHSANFVVCIALSPFLLKEYGSMGAMAAFAVFHLGVLLIQLGSFFKSPLRESLKHG